MSFEITEEYLQQGFTIPNQEWAEQFLIPLRDELQELEEADELPPLTPAISAFKQWVSRNSVYRMLVNLMIEQTDAFILLASGETVAAIESHGDTVFIPSYDMFFEMLNEIVTTSPAFNDTVMVGTPMNGLLAVSMATEAGVALFHDTLFNAEFKKVLDSWNVFLKSAESLDKLDIEDPDKIGSWISPTAYKAGVWNDMKYNPDAPGYGFDSWNSFFIREFVEGAREFKGESTDICIGCETTPWEYSDDIAEETEFWIKDTNYSLFDLFAGNRNLAKMFTGGQLYQGFLSATHYHRWNCPIDGEIVRSWVQPGTYFAQRPGQGEVTGTWEGTASQPYLGHVAARAIFIFKHEQCGYIALLCVGMVEVSTCYILPEYVVNVGDQPKIVKKGEEIGRFEFGGSTHLMIFQKDKVILEDWALRAEENREGDPVHMGSIIARPMYDIEE
eukprot:TRINITY_DN5044_c0_g1_i1.p1 TRINITY_DN5044_c0_g1~~TRINITY_DN5044_c0_g1_i1.p1  ORF type:complete len:445 (+),score=120.67 TRINITY_DN5044_c0_g1_i1:33-1367(+)